ncbi:MAG: cytochrome c [Hyphomonadaceae bacterium]
MFRTVAALAGLVVLAAPAALADAAAGEGVYQARCNMCHGTGMGGAPLTEKLKALEAPAIVEKLTTGTMAPMAAGLTDQDKHDIADFLTKKDDAAN